MATASIATTLSALGNREKHRSRAEQGGQRVARNREEMQRCVFLLVLMGHCSIFMCGLYNYKLVEERMNWENARNHCKTHYTDLATLPLPIILPRNSTSGDSLWIGLHHYPNRSWHWSRPELDFVETQAKWRADEPNNMQPPENCVYVTNRTWVDHGCSYEFPFFCYYEDQCCGERVIFINRTKTWDQAQAYCREHHIDLASDIDIDIDPASNYTHMKIWIGIFADNWRWADGSSFSYRNGDLGNSGASAGTQCAVYNARHSNGTWSAAACSASKSFYCYKDTMVLVKQSMTWEDALDYCRAHHHDLVSITSLEDQILVQEKAKNATTSHIWMGLRYTCTLGLWFWVTDEAISYENWTEDPKMKECDISGAMDRGGRHKWFSYTDSMEFNFICTIREQ